MKRPVIAVDVDDVLASFALDFVSFSNTRWGTNLTVDQYDEHWGKMWQVDNNEVQRRSDEFHASDTVTGMSHHKAAEPVLKRLAESHELIIVTSRRRAIAEATERWLSEKFPSMFSRVIFAGMWDTNASNRHVMTKADIYREIEAEYVIDDQLKHCLAASDNGIKAILYGEYPWNKTDRLPALVTRCHDWLEVGDYFERELQR